MAQPLRGTIGGRAARLGRPGYISPGPLAAQVTRLQDAGATVVLVEHGGTLLGAIAVRDEVRPEAAEAIAQLERQSIEVVMLTGDNARTAAAAGITDVRAELLPADKARDRGRCLRVEASGDQPRGQDQAPRSAGTRGSRD